MICIAPACPPPKTSSRLTERGDVGGEIEQALDGTAITPRYLTNGVWSEFSKIVSYKLSDVMPNVHQEVAEALAGRDRSQARHNRPANPTGFATSQSRLSRVRSKLEDYTMFWKRFAQKKPMIVDLIGSNALFDTVRFLTPNVARVLRVWTDCGGREAEIKDGFVTLNYATPEHTTGVYKLNTGLLLPDLAMEFRGTLQVDPEIVRCLATRSTYVVTVDPTKWKLSMVPSKDRWLRWTLIRHLYRSYRGRFSRREIRRRLRSGVQPTFALVEARRRKYRISLSAGKVPKEWSHLYRERLETAERRADRVERYRNELDAAASRVAEAIAASEFLQRQNAVREVKLRESAYVSARASFWKQCQSAMYQKRLPAEPFILPPWKDNLPQGLFKKVSSRMDRGVRFALTSFNSAYEKLLSAYSQYEALFGVLPVSDLRTECQTAMMAKVETWPRR